MSAARGIYRAAGWWNEHLGRVKTLAWWLVVASAATLVGGGFLIHHYGLVGGLAIGLGVVLFVAATVAFVIDRNLNRKTDPPPPINPTSHAPRLVFGDTDIHNARINQFHAGQIVNTRPARFPIIKLANAESADEYAKDVVLTLYLRTLSDEPLGSFIARCADTDEPLYGSSSKKEHTERDFAPNGRYWSYNTVVLVDGEGYCRPWNNESMHNLQKQIEVETFRVAAVASGSNARATATFEITSFPLSIKRVEDAPRDRQETAGDYVGGDKITTHGPFSPGKIVRGSDND